MDDIFNGLLEVGLTIWQVEELLRNVKPDSEASPGTWAHKQTYLGGEFLIVTRKERGSS